MRATVMYGAGEPRMSSPSAARRGVEKIRELTGGEGTHTVLEAVGHLPALEQALGVVLAGGVISRVGAPQYAPSVQNRGAPLNSSTSTLRKTSAGAPMSTDRPRQTALLAVILLAYLMILIDNSIVFTGVPQIRVDLDLSVTGVSWVQNAYALTFGGLLLLGARAGDVFGRRRVFLAALALFSLASLAVGAAPSGGWLIAARAVQGVGSALLAPSTLGLLAAGFSAGPERARAVGAYGATAGIGAALGLVLGGFITDALSWRVGFLVNVPIGAVLILAALRYVAADTGRPGRTDVAGAVTSTLGMSALVYGIVRAGESGWSDLGTLSALLAASLLLPAFVALERRAAQPIMPLHLFASRQRSGAYAARLLFIGAMISYFLFLSQFLQGVRGFSPLQTGAAFLPMTVVNFATAVPVARLSQRFGAARLLTVGVLTTLIGMAWLSRLSMTARSCSRWPCRWSS